MQSSRQGQFIRDYRQEDADKAAQGKIGLRQCGGMRSLQQEAKEAVEQARAAAEAEMQVCARRVRSMR